MRALLSRAMCATCALACTAAHAQPLSTAFTYQGRLSVSGTPVSGAYDVRFLLFDAPTLGAQVGTTQCVDNLAVTPGGGFATPLDFGAVFSGHRRWLEIRLRQDTGLACDNDTGFVTLSPRHELTAAPHATFALTAASATSATTATTATSAATATTATNAQSLNGQPPTFYQNASNLSSGTLPSDRIAGTYANALSLTNPANVLAGNGAALTSLSASNLSIGTLPDGRLSSNVPLESSANAFTGVNTFSANTGFGVATPQYPVDVASTSGLRAVSASTSAPGAAALYGFASSFTSAGVAGITNIASGYGVVATSSVSSGNGVALLAESASPTGYAVYSQGGRNYFAGNVGVGILPPAWPLTVSGGSNLRSISALNSAVSGQAIVGESTGVGGSGLTGVSSTFSGYGVYAQNTATTGSAIGLFAATASPTGIAVSGVATATSGATYGVLGTANSTSPGAFGVFAQGNLGASGTKSFRIDHPLDPAKHLFHYSAESPEVINFYSGTTLLDASGEAVVALPDYFWAINRDPRYTLTAVGAPMPMLHVAVEVERTQPGNAPTFRIAGGAPGAKVSWEVKAVRDDAWVRSHGVPVELPKQASTSAE